MRLASSNSLGLVMTNPWDIPKPEPLGSRDPDSVYRAVGQALTEWEGVETACARIFAFLVGAPREWHEIAPAVRAFGVVISFPTRCDMITTAGKAFFHLHTEVTPYEKHISDALSEAREFSNRRNEIAHGVVREVVNQQRESEGYYLVPSFYNPKKLPVSMVPAFYYTESNIIYFRQWFTRIGLKLESILQLLSNEPLAKSSSPPSEPRSPQEEGQS
jgi:hypothetical protein